MANPFTSNPTAGFAPSWQALAQQRAMYDPTPMAQQSFAPPPPQMPRQQPQAELRNWNPGWRDTARHWLADRFGGTMAAQRGVDSALEVADFLPVTGDMAGAADTADAYNQGNYWTAGAMGGLTALGAVPGVGSAAKAARKGLKAGLEAAPTIRAYQGSPHDFAAERLVRHPDGRTEYIVGAPDTLPNVPQGAELVQDFPLGRMRRDKMGTGEGAQAYGPGHYLAESEGVARSYRDALSNPTWQGSQVQEEVRNALKRFDSDGEAIEYLNSKMLKAQADGGTFEATVFRDAVNNFTEIKKSVPRGSMYEAHIKASPDELLDWDKPLSEQSELVQRATASMEPDDTGQKFIRDYSSERFSIKDEATNLWKAGSENYDEALKMAGGDPKKVLTILTPDQKAASEALRKSGVKGIRFLDQGSRDTAKMSELAADLAQYKAAAKQWRATGNAEKLKTAEKQIDVLEQRIKKTSNYVVFDDDTIEIIRKYGLAGLVGTGAAAATLSPDSAEAKPRKPYGQALGQQTPK